MLSYPNRILDHPTDRKFRELIDVINNLQLLADSTVDQIKALHVPTFAEIQKALQQGGSNPLNLTGLQPPCPPAGTSGAVTSFSDTLQVVDPFVTNGIGKNWFVGMKAPQNQNAYQFGVPIIGASGSGDGFNALKWNQTNQGGPVTQIYTVCAPIPVAGSLFGLTQFTEVSFPLLAGGVNEACGPAVNLYLSDFGLTTYSWAVRGDGSWNLYRWNSSTPAGLASGAAGAITTNKPCRISSDQSVGGQVTVTLSFNGSVISTTVDNNAQRLGAGGIGAVGSPGLVMVNSQAGTNNEFRTFSCGSGL